MFGAQVVKDGVEHAMTVRQGLDIRCKTKVHRHGEHKHIKAQAQAQERAPPLQQFEVRKWEPRGQRHRDKTKEKQYAERVRARNKLEFDRQQRARDDIAGMEARHEQQLAKNERARGLTPPEHEQQMKGRHAQVDGFDPTDGNPCRAPYVPKFDASEEFMVHEGAPPAAVGQRARKQLEHEPRVIARHEDAKPVPAQVAVIKADARGGIQPARVGADDDPAQKLMLSSSSSSEGEGDEDNDLISHMNTMMDLGLLKPLQGAHGAMPANPGGRTRPTVSPASTFYFGLPVLFGKKSARPPLARQTTRDCPPRARLFPHTCAHCVPLSRGRRVQAINLELEPTPAATRIRKCSC